MSALEKVRNYLSKMNELGGSDLHVKANAYLHSRINGSIEKISDEIFTPEEAIEFAKEILGTEFQTFEKNKESDFVYPFDEFSRFRVNMFFQMDGVSAVFRVIPMTIPTLEQLKLPSALKEFTKVKDGLVLVTGVTGSGKSTTLAAMINEINEHRKQHIITIEDPIEFVHKDNKCLINQRNIGQDSLSFGNALRAALREDPDIILVGEMRDVETIDIALHAAETGHLVFSTLHTRDAKETINRIISTFPSEEQNRIRVALSEALSGVISQRLIPTIDNKRAASLEIMVQTSLIKQMIKDNRDSEILDLIEDGREIYGSQSFDQSLLDLFKNGKISKEKALENATSRSDLQLKMDNIPSDPPRDKDMEFQEDEIFALKSDD
ncbi:MAG: PilT/PilU family type 4a pilus ATPase [Campylobacterota bacterium]|nr:PilT/PilU family type 4a pilus ATPase [Campylobacterota bacterium]